MRIRTFLSLILLSLSFILLVGSLRGIMGAPTAKQLLTKAWNENGPFELSPERGRFGLTYALVEHHSPSFPVDIARFILPDLGYIHGRYVSLFAPALSYIVIPGYIIGKQFSATQVGSFAVISVIAIINVILLRAIAIRLSIHPIAAAIAAVLFLFATPSFSYAVTLYQHHVTVLILLFSLYLLTFPPHALRLFLIFFLYASGIALDYPNMFFLLPLPLFAWITATISISAPSKKGVSWTLHPLPSIATVGAVIPLLLFLWFNTISYGSPLTMLGSRAIQTVHDIDPKGNPITSKSSNEITTLQTQFDEYDKTQTKSRFSYFQSRNILNGLYILFLSPDRGVIVFAPLVIISLFGIGSLMKREPRIMQLTLAIASIHVLLYAMWGDPWGGWAFGARYLIPTYALLALPLAELLSRRSYRIPVAIIVFLISAYAIFVNTAGALSTSANPPKVQVLSLEKITGRQERYSFDRNIALLQSGQSKSVVYRTFFSKRITPLQYYFIIAGALTGIVAVLFLLLIL